jgi:hypothetical protein
MNGRERQLHLRHVAGHLERACVSDESQPHSTKQNTAASRALEKTESQVDTDLRERPDESGVPDKECDHTSGERPVIVDGCQLSSDATTNGKDVPQANRDSRARREVGEDDCVEMVDLLLQLLHIG